MDPRIARLKSTTFCGQRFTRKQIASILDVVETFPLLSRSELALTVCEQLRLQTPSGNNRLRVALNTLAELQDLGLLTLPPPRKQGGRGPQKPIKPSSRTAPQPAVEGPLAALGPVRLALADGRGQVREWNAWVDRYHPLGYRQPIGAHLRYFVLDGQGRKLGFLLFPWVGVKNLASHVLGLAARQVAADWQRQHRYRPVLLETYVDSERYAGTCYRVAGWQCVGKTQGRKAQGRNPAVTPKAVYVRPLHPRWQQALLQGPRALARKKSAARADADVVRVTSEWDRAWMQRQRLLNTLLVVLFVFRLVLAPRNQGYAATATELWDQCRQLDIPLPQSAPVSPGALSRARAKIHPQAFLRVHRAVLQHAPRDDPRALWRGHRVFAVDGSKLNLPRPLVHDGYRLPSETAHYPQGLLSCLLCLGILPAVDFGTMFRFHSRGTAPAAAVIGLACWLATHAGAVRAESLTASISGTVRDGTGAVVPNAELVLRNLGTGVDRRSSCDSLGAYSFTGIAPDTYVPEGWRGGLPERVCPALRAGGESSRDTRLGARGRRVNGVATCKRVVRLPNHCGRSLECSAAPDFPSSSHLSVSSGESGPGWRG